MTKKINKSGNDIIHEGLDRLYGKLDGKEKTDLMERHWEDEEKEIEALPSWEERFDKKVNELRLFRLGDKPIDFGYKSYGGDDKNGKKIIFTVVDFENIKDFIRQTIKTERELAVEDFLNSKVSQERDEIIREQAVKEVLGEIEKGLPKEEKPFDEKVPFIEISKIARNMNTGYSSCLSNVKDFINKLKEKYE